MRLKQYSCVKEILSSDHLPVFATFQVCTSCGPLHDRCNPQVKYNTRERVALTPAEQERKNQREALGAVSALRTMFNDADTDNSGTLDVSELAVVVRKYYNSAGKSRSAKVVQREVLPALALCWFPAILYTPARC